MGNASSSKPLTESQIIELQKTSSLTRREIEEWYKTFVAHQGINDSVMQREKFLKNTTTTGKELQLMNLLFDTYIQYGIQEQKLNLKQVQSTPSSSNLPQPLTTPLSTPSSSQNNNSSISTTTTTSSPLPSTTSTTPLTTTTNTTTTTVGSVGGSVSDRSQQQYQYILQQIQEQQQNPDQLLFQTLLPTLNLYTNGDSAQAFDWGFNLLTTLPRNTGTVGGNQPATSVTTPASTPSSTIVHPVTNNNQQQQNKQTISEKDLIRVLSILFKALNDKYIQALPQEFRTPELCAQYVVNRMQLILSDGENDQNSNNTLKKEEFTRDEFVIYCNYNISASNSPDIPNTDNNNNNNKTSQN